MSAAKLTYDLADTPQDVDLPDLGGEASGWFNQHQQYTRIAIIGESALRCPHCGSVIYSRRNKLCGACSQFLPEEYLFTEAEAQQVEQLLRSEQEQFRKWRKRLFDQALAAPMWKGQ